MKRPISFLTNITISLVSLALFLAAGELYARYLLPEVRDTNIVPLKAVDCKYHHCPGWLGKVDPVDEKAYRIMFLGDSFTMGETRREDAFPQLVGSLFRDGKVDGVPRHVQTFNLGWYSYAPSIEGVILRDYAPEIKPNLVVISVDDSDPQDDLLYREAVVLDETGLPLSVYPDVLPGHPERIPPDLYNLLKRSKLLRIAWNEWYHKLNHRKSANQAAQSEGAIATNRYGHYLPDSGKDWAPTFERTVTRVDAMVEYCRRNGIAVMLVNYPYHPAFMPDGNQRFRDQFNMPGPRLYNPSFHPYLESYARRKNVTYYNFTPFMRALPDKEGLINESSHYTAKTNTYFATELVRVITPLVDQAIQGKH